MDSVRESLGCNLSLFPNPSLCYAKGVDCNHCQSQTTLRTLLPSLKSISTSISEDTDKIALMLMYTAGYYHSLQSLKPLIEIVAVSELTDKADS